MIDAYFNSYPLNLFIKPFSKTALLHFVNKNSTAYYKYVRKKYARFDACKEQIIV